MRGKGWEAAACRHDTEADVIDGGVAQHALLAIIGGYGVPSAPLACGGGPGGEDFSSPGISGASER